MNAPQKKSALGRFFRRLVWTIVILFIIAMVIPPIRRPMLAGLNDLARKILGKDRTDGIESEMTKLNDRLSRMKELIANELEAQPIPGMDPVTNIQVLNTGLTAFQQRQWHRTPEGSDVFPVALFRALNDPVTGLPLIKTFGRYGLIPSPSDHSGLPVGFSRLKDNDHSFVLTGVNCATCHSTHITYRGTTLHIDGAPNLIDVEGFFRAILVALEGVIKEDTEDQMKFVLRFLYYNAIEREKLAATGPALDEQSSLPQQPRAHSFGWRLDVLNEWRKEYGTSYTFLKERVEAAIIIIKSFQQQTPAGPGRADSFGIIRNLLMTPKLVGGDNFQPMTAPVSIPHLFNFHSFTNLHWDGNTTTANDRNYAQAIALGANFDPESFASSVRPRDLYTMETNAHKLTPPAWPAGVFGPLDPAKVARGAQVFSQHCLRCHEKETWVPLAAIGTDPNRLNNYNLPLTVRGGRTESYATNLFKAAIAVKLTAYTNNQIPEAEQRLMDQWHNRVTPMWIETGDKGYFTRRLSGLWTSAPYLHNGSVPTLWDLLQPEQNRPKKFYVGQREFDPVRVGYVQIPRPEDNRWELDTSLSGNHNTGHNYGTGLPDDDKWALIEYLKTL